MKFKVGDKVRHKTVEQASEGIIRAIMDHGYEVHWISWDRLDGKKTVCTDPEHQLELLDSFKIGDYVYHKLVKNYGHITKLLFDGEQHLVRWDTGGEVGAMPCNLELIPINEEPFKSKPIETIEI